MPKRWFGIAVGLLVLVLLFLTALIQTREADGTLPLPRTRRTVIIGLPEDEARTLPHGALALGVYPESRDARAFLAEIGHGFPPRTPGRSARPVRLVNEVRSDGEDVAVWVAPGAERLPIAALANGVTGARRAAGPVEALRAEVAVLILPSAAIAEPLFNDAAANDRVIVIGARARTPVWISAGTAVGVLHDGIARRAGIATPYDVAATILLDPTVTAGRSLRATAADDAEQVVDGLADRLERGLRAEVPLTLTVTLIGVAMVVGGTAAIRRRAGPVAARAASAAAAAPSAYVLALLLPLGSVPRVLVVLALASLGAAALPRAAIPAVALATAGAVCVLAVVASLAPDSFVAEAIWGNPLNSWRFYGLRNHLAAFVTGGLILGALLAGVRGARLAWPTVLAGFIVGGGVFGANFVGVAILVAGVTMAALVRRDDAVRVRAVAWALLAGLGAFIAVLALDSIAPVSHGGRAVLLVERGGFEALVQLLGARVELNLRDVASLGVVGWGSFIGAIAATAALFDVATRDGSLHAHLRGAIAGGSFAALLAFVGEDSGFFTGAIIGLFPWIAYAVARTTPEPLPPLDPARL